MGGAGGLISGEQLEHMKGLCWYLGQSLLPRSGSAEHRAGLWAGTHSRYSTGPPAAARHSLVPGQSGLADAASASCPGGARSSHACSHTHTLQKTTDSKHILAFIHLRFVQSQ